MGDDLFNSAGCGRRYPVNVFWNQGTESANVTYQLASFDSIGVERAAIYDTFGRLQPTYIKCSDRQNNNRDCDKDRLAKYFISFDRFAGNIHMLPRVGGGSDPVRYTFAA